MSDKVTFIDHLQPKENQIRLLKAAEFFSSKDFALCFTDGFSMLQYKGNYAFGILEGAQPTVRKVPYFFGMMHRQKNNPAHLSGLSHLKNRKLVPHLNALLISMGEKMSTCSKHLLKKCLHNSTAP